MPCLRSSQMEEKHWARHGGWGLAQSIHPLSVHAPQNSYEFTNSEALQTLSFRALYGGSLMQT